MSADDQNAIKKFIVWEEGGGGGETKIKKKIKPKREIEKIEKQNSTNRILLNTQF